MQNVFSRRDSRNRVMATLVRNGKELGIYSQHHAGHLRMNVAEEIGRPDAIESDGSLRAGLIQAQIEPLSTIERKNIVEPWIGIRKIDDAANRYDQQRRLKLLVALHKSVARALRSDANRLHCLQRYEPQDDPGGILLRHTAARCRHDG